MTSKQLTDLALRHQIFLEGLKAQTTQDFNKSYLQIEAKTRELLSALDVTNLQEASRIKIEATIRQLESASMTYGNGAIDQLALQMTDYADYASDYEAATLGSMLKSKTPRAVGAVAVMEEVFRQPVPLGDGQATLLSGMYSKLTENEASRLGNSIRNSWLKNDTVMQATRAVIGSAAAGYQDGILNISRRNAAAVVHTSMQHVSTSARFQTYEENDDLVIGYEWISTLDSATTRQCQALDGSKFLFKKAGYQPRPPIHVRCRSTTGPILDDGLDFLDEGATRSSREGYTSAKDTYYDWLRRQSPEEQRKILGVKRYEIFTKGGMTDAQFRKLNLDKNFQPTTLAEMKAASPGVFKKAEKAREGAPLFSAPLQAAPKPGTTTAKVWDIADQLEKELGRIPTGVEVTARAIDQGVNKAVAQSYYSGWKKERLVRVAPPVVPLPPVKPVIPPPVKPVVPPPVKPVVPPPVPPPVVTTIRVPSRVGVRPGSATAGVFDVADEIYTRTGRIPTRAEVLAVTRTKGMSDNVVDSYMVRWRKAVKEIDVTGGTVVKIPGNPVVVPVPPKPAKLDVFDLTTNKARQTQWDAMKDQFDAAANAAQDPAGANQVILTSIDQKLKLLETKYDHATFKKFMGPDGRLDWSAPQELHEAYRNYVREYRVLMDDRNFYLGTGSRNVQTKLDQAFFDIIKRKTTDQGSVALSTVTEADEKVAKSLSMSTAKRWLQELVHPDLLRNAGTIRVKFDRDPRAFYQRFNNSINVNSKTNVSTIVHEVMHGIEYGTPSMQLEAKRFLLKRAGGQPAKRLRDLTGRKGYDVSEIAYEDEWLKRGGSHYVGKEYGRNSTEILTMGIERMMVSPSKFFKEDPGYFEFVTRCLNNIYEITTP